MKKSDLGGGLKVESKETYRQWLKQKEGEIREMDSRIETLQKEIETSRKSGAAPEGGIQPLEGELHDLEERKKLTLEQISIVKRDFARDYPSHRKGSG